MQPVTSARFLCFLKDELAFSKDSLAIVQRHGQENSATLPMILWQYGLVTREQLDRIYDWLENA